MASWPHSVWLVRHGESAGNVARDAALKANLARIDLAQRDVDVPLSARGEQQAAALGRWFAALPVAERPTLVLSSPYARALQTAAAVGAPVADERLREKEFGSLDLLTKRGIEETFPQEAASRAKLGKFYYRPPSGESWCDVIHRLRSVLGELQHTYAGERVAIVAHQVVVLCFRYLFEQLTEAQILAIDREGDVANCSITAYGYDPNAIGGRGGLVLQRYNFVAPLEAAGAPVTAKP